MRKKPGALLVITGLLLALSGVWATSSVAKPDKQPDTTPNDHPSGKDRSQEAGGSGTQGNSPSDPDGMTNGGADKPGGDGGFDADKDGNNGCGNDDDFEDDNNGNCGGLRVSGANAKKDKGHTTDTDDSGVDADVRKDDGGTEIGGTTVVSDHMVRSVGETQVMGVSMVRSAGTAASTTVLGSTAVRSTGMLAATGIPAAGAGALGALLIVLGALLLTGARRARPTLA